MPAVTEQRTRRVALVTGGARRIGRAIVERLAADGWCVVIGCCRSGQEADALAASLPEAHVIEADLSTATDPGRLVRLAYGIHGRLDLVVNNAAVYPRATLAASSAALLDRTWRVNVRAPLLIMREFARLRAESAEGKSHAESVPSASVPPCLCASVLKPHAESAESAESVPSASHAGCAGDTAAVGCVVNILDARIASVRADQTPYWLSKRALVDATRAAALEFAPGLVVNGVAPGSALPPDPAPGRAPRDPAGRAPLGFHPGPEAIAGAVAWLAGTRGVTGHILYVDGGLHLGEARP